MLGLGSYLTLGSALAAAVATGAALYQTSRLETARAETEATVVQLHSCGLRLSTILADLESDNAIDNLPDSALVDVPAHWLRAE